MKVEQQNVENIDYLILTCEEIIKSERQAWFATAVDVTQLRRGDSSTGVDEVSSEDGRKGSLFMKNRAFPVISGETNPGS